MQDLDDGTYHEDEEQPGQQILSLHSILGIEWQTNHSLKLGENDYKPTLVLLIDRGPSL